MINSSAWSRTLFQKHDQPLLRLLLFLFGQSITVLYIWETVFIFFSKILGISILPKEKKRREGKKSKIKGEIDKGNNKAVSAFSFPSYYTTPSSHIYYFFSFMTCVILKRVATGGLMESDKEKERDTTTRFQLKERFSCQLLLWKQRNHWDR